VPVATSVCISGVVVSAQLVCNINLSLRSYNCVVFSSPTFPKNLVILLIKGKKVLNFAM
jgi:hypothetical protein